MQDEPKLTLSIVPQNTDLTNPPQCLSTWVDQAIQATLRARTDLNGNINLCHPETDQPVIVIHKDRPLTEASEALFDRVETPWGVIFYDHKIKHSGHITKGIRYSDQWADLFCEYIMNGARMIDVCKLPNMPRYNQVYVWKNRYPSFAAKLQAAREARGELRADEAHRQSELMLEDAPEEYAKRKAHVDHLMNFAAKDHPKQFSSKVEIHNTAEPIRLVVETGIKHTERYQQTKHIDSAKVSEMLEVGKPDGPKGD